MTPKYPQFIRIDKDVRSKYIESIMNADLFAKKEVTDVYFICASLGLRNNINSVSKGNKADIRLYSTLEDKYKSLIRIIALKDQNGDYNILNDGKKMLEIVEGYANSGARILYDKLYEEQGLDFSIEDEVWDELQS